MRKTIAIFTATLILITFKTNAQTAFKEYKGGHVFEVSLPEYMSKTTGLHESGSLQYKSVLKDVYGFIIVDTKEDLSLVELKYSSLNEFYEAVLGDFLKGEEKRKVSKPVYQTKGDLKFVEIDASYYDKESEIEIYYLAGIVETKTAYYQVLSFGALENKDKFKSDFQKILYSLKD
jgi:hypothetical protein